MNRRTFLKQSATIGAGLTVINSGVLRAGNSPNEKLNVAVIGVAGRGGANLNGVKGENIVALCDVDEAYAARTFKAYPKAKQYKDYRVMLDKEPAIDAVAGLVPCEESGTSTSVRSRSPRDR